MKYIGGLSLILLLLVTISPQLESTSSGESVNDPLEFRVASIDEPDTLDPARTLGRYGEELVFNVYERLISYDRESVVDYIPMLATDWWISDDGITYTFKIREDVKFHNGETLTTEDVEYSFERLMVSGRYGTARFLYEPLLNLLEANSSDPMFGQRINNAIERNATHVWFNLAKPYAPFLGILCQPWCSIVNKDFCVTHGDWPGTWENWLDYHNPDAEHSPLDDPEPVMCGTGPYEFDYWEKGVEWSLVKFDDYWGDWPARMCRGYVERVTVKYVSSWGIRKRMFLNGELDIANVPEANIGDVFGQPGIRCIYPLAKLGCNGLFFNFDANIVSNWLGVPGGLPPGTLDESGIPPDFFSDVDVRKGFAYSINYTEFLQTIHDFYEGTYRGTPALYGLPFRNQEQEKYEFNLTRAGEHFRKAWNGQLWSKGFNFTVLYNEGFPYEDLQRRVICQMLKANVESLNPKFHIEVYMVSMWGDIYIPLLVRGELPLFQLRWSADYPDPHCLFYDFMYSLAADVRIANLQGYSNARVDALIDEGAKTRNETRRREIYYELQQIYFDDCPSITLYQETGRHWQRDWVQGWYYNPAHPGLYFYHLWKEDLPLEDLNADGTVTIIDITVAALAFASYYHIGYIHPRWNSRADMNMDQKVNILDIAIIALKFGSL